jgi:hypothetical protein
MLPHAESNLHSEITRYRKQNNNKNICHQISNIIAAIRWTSVAMAGELTSSSRPSSFPNLESR